MKVDLNRLADIAMLGLDLSVLSTDYDDAEPLELERIALSPSGVAHLAGVPLSVAGCHFADCDMSMLRFVSVKDSLFLDSKLTGTTFVGGVRNVVFRRCLLNECLLRLITVRGVRFEASKLTDCDFYGSKLLNVNFPGSNFQGWDSTSAWWKASTCRKSTNCLSAIREPFEE